jgi:hypothetical protein
MTAAFDRAWSGTLETLLLTLSLTYNSTNNETLEALSLSLQRHFQTLKIYSHVPSKVPTPTPARPVPHSSSPTTTSTEHHHHGDNGQHDHLHHLPDRR